MNDQFKRGDIVMQAWHRVKVIDTRKAPWGRECLVGKLDPEPVGLHPDGSPRLSYGPPHWVPEYLLRTVS